MASPSQNQGTTSTAKNAPGDKNDERSSCPNMHPRDVNDHRDDASWYRDESINANPSRHMDHKNLDDEQTSVDAGRAGGDDEYGDEYRVYGGGRGPGIESPDQKMVRYENDWYPQSHAPAPSKSEDIQRFDDDGNVGQRDTPQFEPSKRPVRYDGYRIGQRH